MRNHHSIGSWRGRKMKELETVANLTMSPSLCIHHFIVYPVSEPLRGSLHTWEVSEWVKLELGIRVWLFDEGLDERNYGFEKVWLFGIMRKPYGHKPGYHIFWLEPHLFTITQHPIPVRIPAALITIPNHLLPE
jgi:hypothetical protein